MLGCVLLVCFCCSVLFLFCFLFSMVLFCVFCCVVVFLWRLFCCVGVLRLSLASFCFLLLCLSFQTRRFRNKSFCDSKSRKGQQTKRKSVFVCLCLCSCGTVVRVRADEHTHAHTHTHTNTQPTHDSHFLLICCTARLWYTQTHSHTNIHTRTNVSAHTAVRVHVRYVRKRKPVRTTYRLLLVTTFCRRVCVQSGSSCACESVWSRIGILVGMRVCA